MAKYLNGTVDMPVWQRYQFSIDLEDESVIATVRYSYPEWITEDEDGAEYIDTDEVDEKTLAALILSEGLTDSLDCDEEVGPISGVDYDVVNTGLA